MLPGSASEITANLHSAISKNVPLLNIFPPDVLGGDSKDILKTICA